VLSNIKAHMCCFRADKSTKQHTVKTTMSSAWKNNALAWWPPGTAPGCTILWRPQCHSSPWKNNAINTKDKKYIVLAHWCYDTPLLSIFLLLINWWSKTCNGEFAECLNFTGMTIYQNCKNYFVKLLLI
jgi:hypothetical protein